MTTLITGIGLVGTSFAQPAHNRGEPQVYLDPQPRRDIQRRKLGEAKLVNNFFNILLTSELGLS